MAGKKKQGTKKDKVFKLDTEGMTLADVIKRVANGGAGQAKPKRNKKGE